MYLLSEDIVFPPVEEADEDGFLAIGGDLSTERLLEAYRNGIFPWYNEDEPICWWSPDPRCVLFPQKLHVSKSMNQLIRKGQFRFSMDTCFTEVMENCRSMARKGEQGSWIQDELIAAYTKLHELGYAHSGETWYDRKLVGGMYGVQLGKIFFGESMFSFMSNASKFALTGFVKELVKQDVQLIDCQMKTDHLLSLGAEMIPRSEFIAILRQYI